MNPPTVCISGSLIGPEQTPFIVAEISGNHNQSLERALGIVDAAAKAGVHALKLQTYTADTMTLDIDEDEFLISDPDSLWKNMSLYELYQQAYTPWEWHKPIMERCKDLGIICFSAPFDLTAVEFLESLDVPAYKIASFENIDLPLISKIAQTGKPIIISTGMATLSELDEAVRCARDSGCKDLILLKCTSSYPATPNESNILAIPHLSRLFNCPVGISDHTLGIGVSLAAITIGAAVVEKHFTIRRGEGGVDAAFSMEPDEMKMLVEESVRVTSSLGQIQYGPTKSEENSKRFRRSLYATEDIEKNEIFTKNNLRIIRPGFGLPPKFYEIVLGRKSSQDIKKGTPINWKSIQ
jgi:N-acetylneuraminate synthase|tara:strand:+ start:2704 stop:3762 length:1059 start_codon:yes stop_codon:yes gene_type:complete